MHERVEVETGSGVTGEQASRGQHEEKLLGQDCAQRLWKCRESGDIVLVSGLLLLAFSKVRSNITCASYKTRYSKKCYT